MTGSLGASMNWPSILSLPFTSILAKEAFLKTQSMARDEVMVALPQDDLLLRDVVIYKKDQKNILN